MPRGKVLSDKEKAEIHILLDLKWSYRKIGEKLMRSHQVISNYAKNKNNYGKNHSGGTKRILNDREVRRILKEASNAITTARQIKDKLNLKCSIRTIQKVLKQSQQLKRKKLKRKPALKKRHKIARLTFAEKHICSAINWENVVFTDEKKFNLDGPDGNNYYFHDLRKEERFLQRRQQGGGGVMVWGTITSNGVMELSILYGRQTSETYLQLLKNHKIIMQRKLQPKKMIFQQDNAAIHTAGVVKKWFQDENIDVLDWPALSPDLNIIENAWGWLSNKVYEGGRQFDNVNQIIPVIQDAWKAIPLSFIQNLYKSIPNRLIDVIKNRGGSTKY